MSIQNIIFSWHLILATFLKMIRRLFTTFILDYPPAGEFLPSSPHLSHSPAFKAPALESLNWLSTVSPCFPVRGDKIAVIHEPSVFYETIVTKCTEAKHRIMLSSLYLGIGKLETRLVGAIHENLKENLKLKVDILLDFTRGTRGIQNSKTTLMPLVKESENCNLSLYHTPVLRGLTKKLAPPRWNELLGIQHMKLYLFDDTVIISGANLSNDYFTNRQDRYIIIEDKKLADFYSELIGKVQEFSFKIDQNGDEKLHDSWNMLPYKSTQKDFATEARDRIRCYFKTVFDKQTFVAENDSEADTWIFPLIEMGQLGIHHDSLATKTLLSSSLKDSKMNFATGYFNLTESYMNTLTHDCPAKCSILMAHPNANGFQGAKGPAGGIPAAYSLIAKNFYEKLKAANQHHRVSLLEYERPGWSYHAKGLWYYLPNSNLPNLTLIGSSNFGERSVNRDLEAQICLVTSNNQLQKKLQAEYEHLHSFASVAEQEITNRPIPRWVKAVVGLFRNFF